VGRPRNEDPKRHQVLIRLTASEIDVVSAIAHLECITPSGLIRRLVEQEVARMTSNPHVVADIANRVAYDEERTGEVVPLTAVQRNRGTKRVR
jgi:hypothetical protein